jgi:hypothetical protein
MPDSPYPGKLSPEELAKLAEAAGFEALAEAEEEPGAFFTSIDYTAAFGLPPDAIGFELPSGGRALYNPELIRRATLKAGEAPPPGFQAVPLDLPDGGHELIYFRPDALRFYDRVPPITVSPLDFLRADPGLSMLSPVLAWKLLEELRAGLAELLERARSSERPLYEALMEHKRHGLPPSAEFWLAIYPERSSVLARDRDSLPPGHSGLLRVRTGADGLPTGWDVYV